MSQSWRFNRLLVVSVAVASTLLLLPDELRGAEPTLNAAAEFRAEGRFVDAQAVVDDLLNMDVDQVPVRLEQARIHAASGDVSEAIRWLGRVLNLGGNVVTTALAEEAVFDGIESHPDFAALRERLHPCPARQDEGGNMLVGNWSVKPTSNPHGPREYFRVSPQIDGCAFLADYGTAYDYKYISLIFYDQATDRWHQRGVDNQGFAMHMEGEWTGDALVLEYDDANYIYKTIFRRVDEQLMHNEILRSPDGGETWSRFFSGEFVREDS